MKRRTTTALGLGAAALLALTACSDNNVFDLAVGDCFDAPSDEDTFQVSSVPIVECSEPHDNEIYALFDMDDADDFPGDDAAVAAAEEGCLSRFEDFVGAPYETSIYYVGALWPSADTWADGDREIVCYVNLGEGNGQLEPGSVEGAAE